MATSERIAILQARPRLGPLTLFPAPVYKNYGGMIARQEFEPAGFKLPLGLKDVRLAMAAAESLNVPLPVASLIRDHFITALARGWEEKDWSAVSLVSSEAAGLPAIG